MGEATAKMNIADLRKILDLPESPESMCDTPSPKEMNDISHQRIQRVRRESMEQLSLIKVVVLCFCFGGFIDVSFLIV